MPEREAYRVMRGINYPPNGDRRRAEVRREPGEVVDDLPPQSVSWLRESGHILPIDDEDDD